MWKQIEISMVNVALKLVVFAFDTINGSNYLWAMTRRRASDAKFELPSYSIDEISENREACVRQCLSSDGISLPEHISVFNIGSDNDECNGEKHISIVYGVFLNDKPEDSFCTYWITDDSLRKPLSESDERILADAKRTLAMQVLCGNQMNFTDESKEKLMAQFVSKDVINQLASQLEGFAKIDVSGLDSIPEDKLVEALESKKDEKRGKDAQKYYVYNYFHPSIAVDIIVLSKKSWQDKNGNWHVDLKIPLIKRSEGVGAGWWGLPGGFISKEHFVNAGWKEDAGETDFNPSNFPSYVSSLNNGKGVIKRAAKDILVEKTGIRLNDDVTLHPLYVRDNPLRGTVDRVPVIAETLLAIVSDYEDKYSELDPVKNSNVEKARWFTVKRFIYTENNELIKEEDGILQIENVARLSLEKRSPLDLSYDADEKEAYLDGDDLVVNYYKSKRDESNKKANFQIPEKLEERQEKCIFADHRDAIIDALQYIKNQAFTTTILKDFMLKPEDDIKTKDIEIGEFQAVYEALVFPEEVSRQSFQSKVIVKDNTGNNEHKPNNGFLMKPEGNPRGKYRIDEEKFEKFIYMQTR